MTKTCGCQTGSIFATIAIIYCVIKPFVLTTRSLTILANLSFVLIAAVIGKVIGKIAARIATRASAAKRASRPTLRRGGC